MAWARQREHSWDGKFSSVRSGRQMKWGNEALVVYETLANDKVKRKEDLAGGREVFRPRFSSTIITKISEGVR
jgi:hypothetical protein